jgi:hypothetical protein
MKSFHIRVKHFLPGNTVLINFFFISPVLLPVFRIEVSVSKSFLCCANDLFCTVKLPISYDRKLFKPLHTVTI